MSETNYRGIDYSGPGATCNRDSETGIRYGIIPVDACTHWVWESFEPNYGDPHCPECGNDAIASDDAEKDIEEYRQYRHCCSDWVCEACKITFDGEYAYPDECIRNTLDDGEYKANIDDWNDVWIFKSAYYTRAQFCSPCAPGACSLTSPCTEGERAYCFGPEWFDDESPLPHPVYSVETDELVDWPADYYDEILFSPIRRMVGCIVSREWDANMERAYWKGYDTICEQWDSIPANPSFTDWKA